MPITHNPFNENELWDKILKEEEKYYNFRSYRECYRSKNQKYSFGTKREAWNDGGNEWRRKSGLLSI